MPEMPESLLEQFVKKLDNSAHDRNALIILVLSTMRELIERTATTGEAVARRIEQTQRELSEDFRAAPVCEIVDLVTSFLRAPDPAKPHKWKLTVIEGGKPSGAPPPGPADKSR